MIEGVILENVLYPAGAVVLILILSIIVTLRHRKPKSVESNMASFNKGLRALAPDAGPERRPPRSTTPASAPTRIRTVRAGTDETVPAPDADTPESAAVPISVEGAEAPDAPEDTEGPTGMTSDTPTSMEAETG